MNFYDTRLRGLAFTNCTVVLYHIHKFSLKMRCSKANRPSVYPLRELPAGARQCGVPDVYPLASSRAERGAGVVP